MNDWISLGLEILSFSVMLAVATAYLRTALTKPMLATMERVTRLEVRMVSIEEANLLLRIARGDNERGISHALEPIYARLDSQDAVLREIKLILEERLNKGE